MPIEFTIIDHSDEVLRALERQIEAGLEGVGNNAVSYAKQTVTAASRIDTSKMINSISHKVEMGEKAVYVGTKSGTNTEYAIYNEYGTGIYIGGGRKSPWAYKDAKGEWHRTRGMKPIHFIRNSIADHINEYKEILRMYLSR